MLFSRRQVFYQRFSNCAFLQKCKHKQTYKHTVSIIRLDTTRPGYQAWVHSSDQTKPQCVPRPGTQAW